MLLHWLPLLLLQIHVMNTLFRATKIKNAKSRMEMLTQFLHMPLTNASLITIAPWNSGVAKKPFTPPLILIPSALTSTKPKHRSLCLMVNVLQEKMIAVCWQKSQPNQSLSLILFCDSQENVCLIWPFKVIIIESRKKFVFWQIKSLIIKLRIHTDRKLILYLKRD